LHDRLGSSKQLLNSQHKEEAVSDAGA
jgi:hypothetical protein